MLAFTSAIILALATLSLGQVPPNKKPGIQLQHFEYESFLNNNNLFIVTQSWICPK